MDNYKKFFQRTRRVTIVRERLSSISHVRDTSFCTLSRLFLEGSEAPCKSQFLHAKHVTERQQNVSEWNSIESISTRAHASAEEKVSYRLIID